MAEQFKAYRLTPEDVLSEQPPDKRDMYSHDQALELLRQLEAYYDYYRFNRRPWTPEMVELYRRWWAAINLLSGVRGAGKSLVAAFVAAIFYSRGHPVFSNIGLRFGYLIEGASVYGLARLPYGSVVVLDEIHAIFNKWSQMRAVQRHGTGSIANLRKRGISIIGLSSQEYNIGVDVMGEVGYVCYPRQLRPKQSASGHARGSVASPADFISASWANVAVDMVGPRPVRGKYIGEQYGVNVQGPKPKKSTWSPPAVAVERAGAYYSSYVDIPSRAQAGAGVSGKDFASIDIDSDVLILEHDDSVEAETDERIQMFEGWSVDLTVGIYDLPLPKGQEHLTYDAAWAMYRDTRGNPATRLEFDEMCTEFYGGDGHQFAVADLLKVCPVRKEDIYAP